MDWKRFVRSICYRIDSNPAFGILTLFVFLFLVIFPTLFVMVWLAMSGNGWWVPVVMFGVAAIYLLFSWILYIAHEI